MSTIEPDDKDWTWTLDRSCPDCGFDTAAVPPADIGRLVTAYTAPWTHVLARQGVATRPDPSTWSPLEYACHVRDVCELFADRVQLMLDEDGARFAQAYAGVSGPTWERRGVRSNASEFTVLTLGRYGLHDLAHHLWDVRA